MYPGYSLTWQPVTNLYSPPVLHPGVTRAAFYLQPEHTNIIGRLIGKNGFHFKNITDMSGCLYIFYVGSQIIEVWGEPASIHKAFCLLQRHVCHHMAKDNNVQKGVL